MKQRLGSYETCMDNYEIGLKGYETCMNSYETSKHRQQIQEGERSEEIGFCLELFLLFKSQTNQEEFQPFEYQEVESIDISNNRNYPFDYI